MPRSQSDLSNTAIRIFLQEVGNFYDKERGLDPFKPTPKQRQSVYHFFEHLCAYCGLRLESDNANLDHLIPLNRTALGLHAWGNVVACCQGCNKEKHFKPWESFLAGKAGPMFDGRRRQIYSFIQKYNYAPELGLHQIAKNLYQDVGSVGMTLARLRLTQAEETIRAIISRRATDSRIADREN